MEDGMPDGGAGGAIVPDLTSTVQTLVQQQVGAMLSNNAPKPETVTPAAGATALASRADHTHPRLTSTDSGTLDANGESIIQFTRTFATKPSWFAAFEDAANSQPVVFKIKTWTQDIDGNYIGCTIKGYRSQTLPTMTIASVLYSVLSLFNLFGGNAAGVVYTFVAIQSSK